MRSVDERPKVAILYSYDESWIGGTYYLENLISALNHLEDGDKPSLIVVATMQNYAALIERVHYPYLSHWERKVPPLAIRVINRAFRILTGRPLIYPKALDCDVVFPADWDLEFRKVRHRVYWIADYQEYFYPQFFPQQELDRRHRLQSRILENEKNLVFSSDAARGHFNERHPNNTLRQFVLPFAVTLPSAPLPRRAELAAKFGLSERYLLCCNQFWRHKNHVLLFRAIALLAERDSNLQFCFTGRQADDRSPGYFDEWNALVDELGIRPRLKFLGFLSRQDQLGLIANATALVQPSLFEGWSTVVEDGKALSARLIVSDIAVHREQLLTYPSVRWFDPQDASSLADAILDVVSRGSEPVSYPYEDDLNAYAGRFLKMLRDLDASEV